MKHLVAFFILILSAACLAQSSAVILKESVTYTISKDGLVKKQVSRNISGRRRSPCVSDPCRGDARNF